MKRYLLLALFFIAIASVFAQTIAPNFTLKNTLGQTYTLYDELNAGKKVVLCFFYISCGPCAAEVPIIQSIFEENDESEFTLMAIETFSATNELIDEFINRYGGSYSGFSTINNDAVLSDSFFDIDYTPQNVVICSDKSYKKVSIDDIQLVINNCPSQVSNINYIENKDFQLLNITNGDNLYVEYYAERDDEIKFEIIDLLGNIKLEKSLIANKGENELHLSKEKLISGYYIFRILNKNMVADVKKFVIF